MEAGYSYAQEVLQFGTTIDSPPLYFITIVDMNGKQIRIGYQSFEVIIEDLIKDYLQITSCKHFITKSPCFKVIQHGQFYGQMAVQSSKLSSYGLRFDKPCFRVHDSSDFNMENELANSISRIYEVYEKVDFIPVKILVQGVEHKFQISLEETLKELKERLIDRFEIIKKQLPTNINLMVNGFFLQDDESTMLSYRITNNMEIKVVIKQKGGCLSSNTLILTKQGERAISELKVGDQIMSYNEKTVSLQVDQVTYVHQSFIDQCIQIETEDETLIRTTSNHFFLCQDNQYRKVDEQRDSIMRLQVGSRLRRPNNKIGVVAAIKSKYFAKGQTFYHICVGNNHNFICNQFITHNMFLNIIIPDGSTERVNIQPNQPFSIIKEYFQQNFQIQTHNQRLLYLGKEVKNHQTMTDKNIPKQSNIYLKFRPADQFNFLHPKTPILTRDGKLIPIADIKEGQYVLTYDSVNSRPIAGGDLVVSIVKKEVRGMMSLKIDFYEQEIVMFTDSYLQLENGEAMNIMDLCYQYDYGSWPKLKKIDGSNVSTYKIKQIAHQDIKPTFYYKLILSESSNYIAKNVIIHNSIVNIFLKKNNIKDRKITLGVKENDTIGSIKKRLSQIIGISANQIELSFENRSLTNQYDISYYNIRSQNIITANSLQKVSKSSFIISQIKHVKRRNDEVYLQLSQNQKIKLFYQNYREKTVEQIMQEIIPNYQSSYFFTFLNIVILPFEPLKKIEESQDEFGENVIIVVRNEKLAFIQNMNIKPSQIKSYSKIFKKASIKKEKQDKEEKSLNSSRILVHREKKLSEQFEQAKDRIQSDKSIEIIDFKGQKFHMPFLYFTSKQYHNRIWKRIKNFNKYKEQVNQNDSTYSIIKDLYVNMNMLDSYYGKCFFGMKNFKCSRFFQNNNTFYWHSFIIAHLNNTQIIKEIQSQNGTLFIIESLNGKQISKFSLHPSRQQVLFAPFTYFMIQKIETKQSFDIVWLSQISSPVTFQKNIVLWVDDEPKNNKSQIKTILAKHDIEILQVTSTVLAEKWVKEFGWLLNWKGLQFKLISDMTRVENGTSNSEAGVDLLELFYKNHGITAETLIYCRNRANAQEKIKARQIPRERFFSIAVQSKQVLKFCQMEDREDLI